MPDVDAAMLTRPPSARADRVTRLRLFEPPGRATGRRWIRSFTRGHATHRRPTPFRRAVHSGVRRASDPTLRASLAHGHAPGARSRSRSGPRRDSWCSTTSGLCLGGSRSGADADERVSTVARWVYQRMMQVARARHWGRQGQPVAPGYRRLRTAARAPGRDPCGSRSAGGRALSHDARGANVGLPCSSGASSCRSPGHSARDARS
jgi:hypothetical protein